MLKGGFSTLWSPRAGPDAPGLPLPVKRRRCWRGWPRVFLLVAGLSLLAGCGYRLLGLAEASLELGQVQGPVRVEARAGFWEMGRALREALAAQGVELVEVAGDAAFVVAIRDERSQRSPVSTTASIDAAEYELRLEVDIAISAPGEEGWRAATLVSERVYSVDAANLAGSQEEEALLREEIREELARMALRRLQAVASKPLKAVNNKPLKAVNNKPLKAAQ